MGEWAGYAGFADIHFYSPPLAGPRARGRRETQILHLGHQHVLQEAHTRRTEKEVGEVFTSHHCHSSITSTNLNAAKKLFPACSVER